mgnify:CR=1 FL=1
MNLLRPLVQLTPLAALCAALPALATNGMLMEGYGPVSTGMGGASQAFDHGTAAMAQNPATLALMKSSSRHDAAFGVLGFLFERHGFPIAPLVLGTILGPLAETNFMTTMVSFDNDWTVFFTRPISGAILALAAAGLAWPLAKAALERVRAAGGARAGPG